MLELIQSQEPLRQDAGRALPFRVPVRPGASFATVFEDPAGVRRAGRTALLQASAGDAEARREIISH